MIDPEEFEKTIAKCKFCEKQIFLQIHKDCPPLDQKIWTSMAACNRCADYKVTLRKIYEAGNAMVLEYARSGNDQLKQAAAPVTRRALEDTTKKLARVVCNHYNVEYTWDRDLVDAIMEQPDKCAMAMSYFETQIKRVRKQADQQAKQSKRIVENATDLIPRT
jgi:glycosyltransferase A (GT-A) superfamily protein (DUF2064 family)